MKLSDLKNGMVVKFRGGDLLLVVEINETKILVNNYMWTRLSNYSQDMETLYNFKDFDIIEVYNGDFGNLHSMLNLSNKQPIWTRYEKKKMTVSEIEKELGYEIEIVKG